MVAILEKSEHNVDFHLIVDFVEASPLRYALTFKPTVYVSHIRQFWFTARIETMEEGTKILATIGGILRTVTESSLRRNLKLQDEEGINSLPDANIFENLTLLGYNISPNQKLLFKRDECSGTPTEPHYTPSPEAQQTSSTTPSSPTLPSVTTALIPTVTPSDTPTLKQYTRRARIAQSSALLPVVDEPASPLRDVSEGEACPTDSSFEADHDRANIAKSFTLPHDSAPRVTSSAANEAKDREGMAAERSRDDASIKGRNLDEGEAAAERVSDDTKEMATILTSMDATTVLASRVAEVPTGSGSIPTAGPPAADVPTGGDVVPTAGPIFATATVVTPYTRRKGKETLVESETPKKKKVQEQIDAQVVRELEEQMAREDHRMTEQVARDAEIARIHAEEELQIMIDGLDKSNETIAKYLQEYHQFASKFPLERRIELISDLVRYQDNYAKVHKYQSQQRKLWSKKQKRDYYMAIIRSNLGWKVKDFRGMTFEEIKAKFTTVWKQIENFIPIGSKEEAERFKRKGIMFEQESVKKLKTSESVPEEVNSPDEVPEEKVKEMMQLVPIEEVYVEALQVKHPIIDWKVHIEGHKSYWKITRLGGSSASYQFFIDMLKHLDREDLNQLWALVKESLSNMPPINDKEIELLVELKRLYEPDDEDQLWTHTQNLMHAPVEWKLYDTCRVHHVTTKDKEIFMLVEKDYPLRKGLAIRMTSYKLQVENYSKMANDLILKIYKIASSPRQQGKFKAKGDEGYFIGYYMSSKAFRVFNKRTKRVKENLHVEFLENKAIKKGAGPNWLFDIDSLTKSMNNVPVDAGTNSTNLSGTKDAARQEVKKDVSSLRYIALPNWVHDALLESLSSKPQDDCSTDVPERSGNFNPTADSTNPPADQLETLTVETPIPTISSPVPTACYTDSPEPSSDTRLISKRVANQVETPSLYNILTLANRFEDILGVTTNSVDSDGVEADVSNMETTITASPTPTLRIHKDHTKMKVRLGLLTLALKKIRTGQRAKSSTLPHDSAPRVTSPAADEGGEENEVSWIDEEALSRVEEKVCFLCLFEINPRVEKRMREGLCEGKIRLEGLKIKNKDDENKNTDTGKNGTLPDEKLKDDNKKMLSKNNEAKLVLYNAFIKKEYERIFMCKTAKHIWNSLLINPKGTSRSSLEEEENSFDNYTTKKGLSQSKGRKDGKGR
nr:ribonuclease H-like domain-containing protein [Tanacetum cinerariifolium]